MGNDNLVTKNDLKKFGNLMDKKLDKRFSGFEKSLELKLLNWKSNIIKAIDVSEKEIGIGGALRTIANDRTADNARRIEKLETKVFGSVEN